jgi:hypothetical protein
MTIEAAFTDLFRRREPGRETPSATETKSQVAAKPKQEPNVSTAVQTVPPSTPEPVWKAYGLDVSAT